MRRRRSLLRIASKPALAVVVLAVLGLSAGGAYVALAGPKPSRPDPPRITSAPASPTNATSASFTYTHAPAATFLCSIDGGSYGACGSGTGGAKSYAGPLAQGSHTFRVEAQIGSATSDPAQWTWVVDTTPPPAPTIFVHPDDPTADTSPSFAYGVGDSSAGFQCRLDGAAFQPCSSSKSYSGLALGGHTFRVKATDRAGNEGATTAFAWTIVAPAPPQPRVTGGPADPTNQTAATLTYTDSVSATFLCSLDGGAYGACGSGTSGTKSYAGPLADGQHTFRVAATRSGAMTSDPALWRWTVDTTPPPAPTFKKTPSNPTDDTTASFQWKDDESGVAFQCRLDGGSYVSCGTKTTYGNLAQGAHTFCVRAIDRAGNAATACFSWQIGQSALNFTMAGSPLPGVLLYPGGAAVPINLVFTNPNGSPITIQSVTVSVAGTSVAACSSGNFTIAHQLSATPTVPANSTRSLQDLGVPQSAWPQLQMVSSGNQNACQSATVSLSYTGTANG